MKPLSEMYTVGEVYGLIDEIGRNLSAEQRTELLKQAVTATAAERAANPQLDAVCKALERLRELARESRSDFRSPGDSPYIRI